MSRPVYEIEHESDGWWTVMRNGGYRCESFATEAEAEAAIVSYELEDDEEANEERDERMDRGDFEFHRDHDQ